MHTSGCHRTTHCTSCEAGEQPEQQQRRQKQNRWKNLIDSSNVNGGNHRGAGGSKAARRVNTRGVCRWARH